MMKNWFVTGLVALSCACSDVGSFGPEFYALPVYPGTLGVDAIYGVSARGDVRHLGVALTLRNVGSEPFVGEGGPSGWWLEAFVTPDRKGPPVWTGRVGDARQQLFGFEIQPGDSMRIGGGNLDLLGRVPAGMYYMRASWVLESPRMRTAFLPAGQVDIE